MNHKALSWICHPFLLSEPRSWLFTEFSHSGETQTIQPSPKRPELLIVVHRDMDFYPRGLHGVSGALVLTCILLKIVLTGKLYGREKLHQI